MNTEEFKNLCVEYLPTCFFKDNGECGLCCYLGGYSIHAIVVSLLKDGRFAVYDQWRDVTITKDVEYVKKWLEEKKRYCK